MSWTEQDADKGHTMQTITNFPHVIKGTDLGSDPETLAEELHDDGFCVRVNRRGTGNGEHTGILAGCYVESIEVTGRWQ